MVSRLSVLNSAVDARAHRSKDCLMGMTPRMPDMNRLRTMFWKRVIKSDGCWVWAGSLNWYGYGNLYHFGVNYRAHRLSLIFAGVSVPTHLVVDHICRKPSCVNPQHLRVVDHRTNALENSTSIAAQNKTKTHCVNGHEFSSKNTVERIRNGRRSRVCLQCRNENNWARYS